jgi:two-component system, OmpR family, sensor histidine kinase QseC
MPAGGRVEVRVSANGSGLLREVSDSGAVTPPSERAALARFQRGHSADVHNSGLRLWIVRRIASLHSARVELQDSRFGCGLLLRVQFPARVLQYNPLKFATAGR